MTPEEIFLSNLRLIEKIAEHACRRHHFRREEAQDFASTVKLKLIENDYGVIRKFKGDSSLGTFLNVVIQRLMLDYMNHLWGKYRPSNEAKRLGWVAILLEFLRVREGLSFDEACRILQTNHHVQMSWQELAKLEARLPIRSLRAPEEGTVPEDIPDEGVQTDALLKAQEREAIRKRVEASLQRALKALPPENRLILKMRMRDGFKVAEIAKCLSLEPKGLYRRIDGILKTLREALQRDGISAADIAEILDCPEH